MVSELIYHDTDAVRLEIYTLGRFAVRFGDRVLSDETRRSRRLWQLFTYLFKNRDREVPSETLGDYLWENEDVADPQGALHNLIYRLRRIFETLPCDDSPVTIEYSQVGYVLRLASSTWCDIDEFLSLVQRASSLVSSDPAEALCAYREAITLYEGHYLPGRSHEPWVVFAGRQYRQTYVEAVKALMELLRKPGRYAEIIEVGEQVLSIEDFLDAEEIHYSLMEALSKQGRADDALNHYDLIAGRLHSAYGRRPSSSIQNLYAVIGDRRQETGAETLQLEVGPLVQLLVGADDAMGAYLCDREAFRHLLYLNHRQRTESSEHRSFVGLLTVTSDRGDIPPRAILTRAMNELRNALTVTLRQGDLISQWNEAQYLVLLLHCRDEVAQRCAERLVQSFETVFGNRTVVLHCQFKAL